MYSLNCNYFKKEFKTIDDLLKHCMENAIDPNYEITKNGKLTGEELIDLLVF